MKNRNFSFKNTRFHEVTEIKKGIRYSLIAFFYKDINMVVLSRLHNSKDVSVTPTSPEWVIPIVGIIKKTHGRTCVAVCEDGARLQWIVVWAGK